MPRKLPWEQGQTTSIGPKRLLVPSSSPAKRQKRVERQVPPIDSEKKAASTERDGNEQPEPPSSPPPEPPTEEFMTEGLENDDRYRMVEDEFLSIAKQFTVHLHTAEYKRQEKMVKSRNAHTITTISRPVVGKMPNHTMKKVQAIELAKTQRTALAGILGKKTENPEISDDSDGDVLPYIGTTLHGLMDKPRNRAVSLTKVVPAVTATRSANGFTKPIGRSKNESPRTKSQPILNYSPDHQSSTASEGEDDLDAPVPIQRRIQPESQVPSRTQRTHLSSTAGKTSISSNVVVSSSLEHSKSLLGSHKQESGRPEKAIGASDQTSPAAQVPRISRFEQARRLKASQEIQGKEKKNLDVIPSFL